MNATNKQELQIVQAFSSIVVPEKVIKDSNIRELVQEILGAQSTVQNNADRLDRMRQEKRDGNFVGNWWNDRDDKVQDAQLDLSTSIGRLTQTSARLLVVNTAISKVLSDQQNILLRQQGVLEEQARELKGQNEKILSQQVLLAAQQENINAANKGLMEAKGLTQDQALKLVGCVKRVTEAEQKIDLANELLRTTMQKTLDEAVAQCVGRIDQVYAETQQTHAMAERKLDGLMASSVRENQQALVRAGEQLKTDVLVRLESLLAPVHETMAAQHAAIERQRVDVELQLTGVENVMQKARHDTDTRIDALLATQAVADRKMKWGLALTASVAVLSLGWQFVHHAGL